jgi:hypothetical protein
MTPSGRLYAEDRWEFRVADRALKVLADLILEIEFVDDGYGILAASRFVDDSFDGRYAAASRSVSYTRLGTGRIRVAAFRFTDAPAAPLAGERADIVVTGLQGLVSARLVTGAGEAYWLQRQAAIPRDVTPAVRLSRPVQIGTTAGVAVLGRDGLLEPSISALRELAPLAKALGFTAIEAYVRWDMVEPEQGRFDWSFYDAVVDELRPLGLKLFPLLIVGSAYALPDWFFRSEENVGFVCLEHGLSNPIQSIWSPYHRKHVTRFLQAFGAHYEPMKCLEAVRLGPSGNYGESQYPAAGDWGFHGEKMHLHIGMWAGDPYALGDFQQFLKRKYWTPDALSAAWGRTVSAFDDVRLKLPEQCVSRRERVDIYAWYTNSMSDWCEWWAVEARKAMPNTPIYQSAGGWGAAEIGTDYSAQTKSMLKIGGGIRLTNELDSFHQAYYATRLACTAARNYGIPLGFEPAMGHTARGTAGRIFNCVSNGGAHFFTYHGNVLGQQTSIASWLKHYPLFDYVHDPLVETALVYPQTMNFLSHDTFRYLNAWGFNPYARAIRDRVEIDYLDERLINDGFLDRYKALVFAWGSAVEAETLERIDAWLRRGGTVIFPYFLNAELGTVEGDVSTFRRWKKGDFGSGTFRHFVGDDEPPEVYAEFVRKSLLEMPSLSPITRAAIEAKRPVGVFLSASKSGDLLILNFTDDPAVVEHASLGKVTIAPYAIVRAPRVS